MPIRPHAPASSAQARPANSHAQSGLHDLPLETPTADLSLWSFPKLGVQINLSVKILLHLGGAFCLDPFVKRTRAFLCGGSRRFSWDGLGAEP